MPVNDYLVPLVTCTLTAVIVCLNTTPICSCLLNTIIVIIIRVLGLFMVIAMLYASIGIGIGYWYDLGTGYWYRSNPSLSGQKN